MVTEHKHYLQAVGITFAIPTKREGAAINASSTGTLKAQQVRYEYAGRCLAQK
jgi:hypothetical protein